MQAGTPEQYEDEARRFDEMADAREAQGKMYLARQYRETAEHNRERAAQVRKTEGN